MSSCFVDYIAAKQDWPREGLSTSRAGVAQRKTSVEGDPMMAVPLPAELYLQPEAFQRERRNVFGIAWLLLARANALRTPGDYVAHSLGGWPVFAMADWSGAPRAFRNVCRHQKLPLFDAGVGHCEQIRCRYHGWTYDTAGRFVSAPPQAAPTDGFARDLEPVVSEQFQGLLFVHLDDRPEPLARSITGLAPALAEVGLGSLAFRSETTTDVDANWKLVMEHALALEASGVTRRVEWPCTVLDVSAHGAVVHQVVARSFHRTRIHHHSYGTVLFGDEAMAQWKSGARSLQSALEAGAAPALPESPALERFRGLVRAAHEQGTSL